MSKEDFSSATGFVSGFGNTIGVGIGAGVGVAVAGVAGVGVVITGAATGVGTTGVGVVIVGAGFCNVSIIDLTSVFAGSISKISLHPCIASSFFPSFCHCLI